MKVGDLVRHIKYPDALGVVTYVGEHKITFVRTDGRFWKTYPKYLEKMCK